MYLCTTSTGMQMVKALDHTSKYAHNTSWCCGVGHTPFSLISHGSNMERYVGKIETISLLPTLLKGCRAYTGE